MVLDGSLVGQEIGCIEVVCDVCWVMVYAVGVFDEWFELYDMIWLFVVHLLFFVVFEWELLVIYCIVLWVMFFFEVLRGVYVLYDLILV